MHCVAQKPLPREYLRYKKNAEKFSQMTAWNKPEVGKTRDRKKTHKITTRTEEKYKVTHANKKRHKIQVLSKCNTYKSQQKTMKQSTTNLQIIYN